MLEEKFNFNLSREDKKLPHMSWLPKLHKHPTGSIFIIAPTKGSAKPFSKALISILILFSSKLKLQ